MTASAPHAAQITLAETLGLLDAHFAETVEGVAADKYGFWLGSGISLGRMPGLKDVVEIALDHLQTQVDQTNPECPFRGSLELAFNLAKLTDDEKLEIDFGARASAWPHIKKLRDNLEPEYARLLDAAPENREPDYMVWTGIDVVGRFADPTLEPDAEHIAIAALVLEGVASDIASANWDGLVEKAVDQFGGPDLLQVAVLPEDIRVPKIRSRLYKFHGCAVLAGKNEAVYRPRMVGRKSQLNNWVAAGENRVIAGRLIDLVTTKPTFMLGLSAQDSNIQHVFAAADARMAWPFPSHPPAYVFSEDKLGFDQVGLLQNVYRTAYSSNRRVIMESALLKAFAKPLLASLWLAVLTSKLAAIVHLAANDMPDAERDAVRAGIRALRDHVASGAPIDQHEAFLRAALPWVGRLMSLFHDGQLPALGSVPYRPLSVHPTPQLLADPATASSGLGGLAVATGLIGMGVDRGLWAATAASPADPKSGALGLESPAKTSQMFFAANAQSAGRLFEQGHIGEQDDAIIVHSEAIAPAMPRAPRPMPGRKAEPALRQVSIAEITRGATSAADLFQRFHEKII